MELKSIKQTQCKVCGAPTVAERVHTDQRGKILTHVNGGQWETREFGCGSWLEFVPNFERAEVRRQCPHEPSEKERRMKHEGLITAVATLVANSDADETFKQRILNRIDGCG